MKKIKLKNSGLHINRISELKSNMDPAGISIGEYKVTAPNFVEDSSLPVAMRIKKSGDLVVKSIIEGEDGDMSLYINPITIPMLYVEKAMTPVTLTCNQSGVTWSIILGQLPPGVYFSNGVISGTPQRPGTFYVLFGCNKSERWASRGVTITCGDKICRVTFNANGGSCSESYRNVAKYTMLGNLPTPKMNGQVFGGWFTAATGGLPIDSKYTVIDDVTFYARWGQSSNVQFGDPTTQFNIHYMGNRTNYGDGPYTLYGIRKGQTDASGDLVFQTGIQSTYGNSNDLTNLNSRVTLYLKITNNGEAGYFNIGFDCDSYVINDNDDRVRIRRTYNGIQLGNALTVSVTYPHNVWAGLYYERTQHRLDDLSIGSVTGDIDSGYAFTMQNIFINSNSYTILEVTFKKL